MTGLSEKLKRFEHVLSALNPKLVMKRGYSFVKGPDDEVIPTIESFKKITPGTKILIQFYDGQGIVSKEVQ
jgi:exonuclease VII large subunit